MMKGKRLALVLVALVCVLLAAAGILWVILDREPTRGSPPGVTTSPVPPEPAPEVVRIHLSEESTTRVLAEMVVGDLARMELTFEPALYQVMRRPDGSVYSESFQPLESHSVTEMQVCTALDQPCQLEGDWLPFAPQQVREIPVDWLGTRELWLTASFRDADGRVILSLGSGHGGPADVSQSSYTIVGTVADGSPVEALPEEVQTAVAATRTAYPVQGSVEIEGGRCCAGGTAGDTIQLSVAFKAESPAGEVREMRVRTGGACFPEEEMAVAEWQPLSPEQAYSFRVPTNWVGFYASVQYRDEAGNLSAVACDDISVEGHPSTPTP